MANDMDAARAAAPLTVAAMYFGAGALGWFAGGWLAARQRAQRAEPTAAPAARPVEPGTALARPPASPATAEPGAEPPTLHPTEAAAGSAVAARPGAPLDPYPDGAASGPRLSRRFDPVFEAHRGAIPIEYLRALAMRESGLRPDVSSGPAWGLLQITEVVRNDYNRTHGTSYPRERLLDPTVNVVIACWLLRRVMESYQRHHSDVPHLRVDWNNPHFIGLLTQGWNAGFSEVAGVGRVAGYLKARGMDVTIDTIQQHAAAAGAVRFLGEPGRLTWCRSVVALYQRERVHEGAARRGVSWWAVKTPGVILDELRVAREEIEALGRDIYATFRHPFERELATAVQRFEATYGRKPGVGPEQDDADFPTVHSWMQPEPTATDLKHVSYQGQFVHEWGVFERAFGDFWADKSGSWTDRIWTGVYDRTVEFRKRAADWRQRFQELGGTPTTPPPRPPTESFLDGIAIPWKTILLVGGGLAAGVVVVPAAIRALRRD